MPYTAKSSPPRVDNANVTTRGSRSTRALVITEEATQTTHHFPMPAFRAYIRFDSSIRKRRGRLPSDGEIPGGYVEFQRLWSLDKDSTHGFCAVDLTTRTATIIGEGIPINHLDYFAPELAPKVVEREVSNQSEDDQALLSRLARHVAERELRQSEARSKAIKAKKHKLDEELEEQDKEERDRRRRKRTHHGQPHSSRIRSLSPHAEASAPLPAPSSSHPEGPSSRARRPRRVIQGPDGPMSDFESMESGDDEDQGRAKEKKKKNAPPPSGAHDKDKPKDAGDKVFMDTSA